MNPSAEHSTQVAIRRAIIVCALGYFIDIFDLNLFVVLRLPSLISIGIPAARMAAVSGYILDAQMFGMILGAFLWGWLGDRFGRLKALYGSILIYSIGTLACSFVYNSITYGVLRFIAGFGLAGESGASITLVAELMSTQRRGWGVTITTAIGFLGPLFAILISWFVSWRQTYVIAGLMGFILLIIRLKLIEPELFCKVSSYDINRGSLKLIFQKPQFLNFICCVLIGAAIIYNFSLLNFFSLELSRSILVPGEIFNQKVCLFLFFIGTAFGDVLSGTASQLWQSRKGALATSLIGGFLLATVYLLVGPQLKFSVPLFYLIYFLLGLFAGCFALLAMISAEHFGTNIRATTAITVTNLARGCSIPMLFAFQALREITSITNAAALVGGVLYGVSFVSLLHLRETSGIDLDFVEEM